MLFSFVRSVIVGVLALTCLGYFFQQSNTVDINEHDRYINVLRKLQQLDVSLNENILKARHVYMINYDPLVDNLAQLRATNKKLSEIPAYVSVADREKIRTLHGNYMALFAEKEAVTERFKSENSILRNSLSFFPIAANELAAKVSDKEKTLSLLLQNLVRDVLLHNLYSHDKLQQDITDKITRLRENVESFKEFVEPKDLERIINHAETILRYKSSLDKQDRILLELPTRKYLEEIYYIYNNEYVSSLTQANVYRLVLNLAIIALVAIIGHTFIRLTNTKNALQLANIGLEQRVTERTAELEEANVTLKDQKDQLADYVLEIRSSQEELQRIAITDDLTSLFTRRFLFEWMEKEVEALSRNPGVYCCLLIDVDHFKSVNDEYGHQEGDNALIAVSQAISRAVRQADIVGRYGGEEFLVLLPNTPYEHAHIVAEKVRLQVEDEVKSPRQITISIGVAGCYAPEETRGRHNTSESIAMMLEIADQSLYKAKESGRNRVILEGKPVNITS